MRVETLDIHEVLLLRPTQHRDERGFFSETYNQRALASIGIDVQFVQDNHVLSRAKGTIRGLHFQSHPFAQDKLVRVIRGAIFDVAVDLRVGSPTFGQHVSSIINANTWNQIFIPVGFAHGLATLEPNTEVIYKVSSRYSPQHDKGLLWNDPVLAIDWPVNEAKAILSEKDKQLPTLDQLPDYFEYHLTEVQ